MQDSVAKAKHRTVSSPSGSHILPDERSKGAVVKIVFYNVTAVSVKMSVAKAFSNLEIPDLTTSKFFQQQPLCVCNTSQFILSMQYLHHLQQRRKLV